MTLSEIVATNGRPSLHKSYKMAYEVFGSLFNTTIGLLSNKVYVLRARNKLQDGDLTYGKFSQLIIRELDDIRSKYDGLWHKDLHTSICFLKEGIIGLQISLGQFESENPTTFCELQTNNAVALANTIQKLSIESSVRFDCAKESIKEAGIQARRTVYNKALPIEERIYASKVLVASGILEHLDDLEVAAADCLFFLRELHTLPAIEEMFSVHLNGGMRSLFNRVRRAKIVQSVRMINLFVADFISKFTTQRMAVFFLASDRTLFSSKLLIQFITRKRVNQMNKKWK